MGKKNSAHRSRKGFSLLITLFRWERMGKFGKEWENTLCDCCTFVLVKASEPKGRHL